MEICNVQFGYVYSSREMARNIKRNFNLSAFNQNPNDSALGSILDAMNLKSGNFFRPTPYIKLKVQWFLSVWCCTKCPMFWAYFTSDVEDFTTWSQLSNSLLRVLVELQQKEQGIQITIDVRAACP